MEIIVYGSQYGTSKSYAEELAKRTGIDAISHKDVRNINAYDTIVYIGALYAGGVMGMKKCFEKLQSANGKKIIIATVGLADPTDEENVTNIRNSMKTQLSAELFDAARIFHLRGGIDYSRLTFKHRTMMGLLYKKVSKLPEEEQSGEVRAMLETYNKKVDFVDFESLDQIVRAIEG